MFDTIVMKINSRDFRLTNLKDFTPPATDLYKSYKGINSHSKYIRNPTKAEKEIGYKPRITIYKTSFEYGGYKADMFIEFSAPKLVFGNNFEELTVPAIKIHNSGEPASGTIGFTPESEVEALIKLYV
ncbi:MAG: hypothetical protein GY804_14230 [Alphaproteobacteria bacterium]|nr:hypothetical protein [Alphaproteobacteria bacterium]